MSCMNKLVQGVCKLLLYVYLLRNTSTVTTYMYVHTLLWNPPLMYMYMCYIVHV